MTLVSTLIGPKLNSHDKGSQVKRVGFVLKVKEDLIGEYRVEASGGLATDA